MEQQCSISVRLSYDDTTPHHQWQCGCQYILPFGCRLCVRHNPIAMGDIQHFGPYHTQQHKRLNYSTKCSRKANGFYFHLRIHAANVIAEKVIGIIVSFPIEKIVHTTIDRSLARSNGRSIVHKHTHIAYIHK